MDSRGVSLIMVKYFLRGYLWVVPIEPTICYILPREHACRIFILSSCVDKIMDCIAWIDGTTTGPVSSPPRYGLWLLSWQLATSMLLIERVFAYTGV